MRFRQSTDSKLRILHTESSCGWGGQELRLLGDAMASQAAGHQVAVCCDPNSMLAQRVDDASVLLEIVPIAKKSLSGLLSMMTVLRQFQPDLVITHSSTDSWLVAVSRVLLCKADFALIRLRHVSAPIARDRFTRWLYHEANHVICTSGAIAASIHQATGLPAAQISPIPTGVDIKHFCPVESGSRAEARMALGIPPNSLCIGMVATLRSWKGHRFVIQALVELPKVHLLIAGDGPQKESLHQLVVELGVSHRVHFLGHLADPLVAYQAMDIFIQPSTANEGVSQSVLQAMACALPVIVSDIGGLREPILKNKTGLLVPPESVPATIAIIRRVIDQLDGEFSSLGHAAREHVVTNYSRQQSEKQMELIFQRFSERVEKR